MFYNIFGNCENRLLDSRLVYLMDESEIVSLLREREISRRLCYFHRSRCSNRLLCSTFDTVYMYYFILINLQYSNICDQIIYVLIAPKVLYTLFNLKLHQEIRTYWR